MTETPLSLGQIGEELAGHARELRTVAEEVAAAADAIARDMHGLARVAGDGRAENPAELSALAQHTTASAEEIHGLADWLRMCATTLTALADSLLRPAQPTPTPVPEVVPAAGWAGAGCPAATEEVTACSDRA